jgi:hypothetical protein
MNLDPDDQLVQHENKSLAVFMFKNQTFLVSDQFPGGNLSEEAAVFSS